MSEDSNYWAAERYRDHLHSDRWDGTIAGLLGGGLIMVLTLLFDALLFKPLVTPDSLARALIQGMWGNGADGSAEERLLRIGIFTVIHLAVFILLGIVLVKLFRIAGIRKKLLTGGLYGITACTSLFGVSLQLSGAEISLGPKTLAVVLVNLLAGLVMGGYLEARTRRRQHDGS